jgi:hypothetical protein
MKALRLIALSVGLSAFALAGCSNTKVVQETEKFADSMCECSDKECAEKVHSEFETWMTNNAEAKGTKGDEEKVMKAVTRYMECYQKVVLGGG